MAEKKLFLKKSAYVACSGASPDCAYGCTGCSACISVCPRDALSYDGNKAVQVDEELCVGCGLCVKACPRKIISLHTAQEPFLVKCANRERGADARSVCDRSCIGCGLCSKNCPSQAVRIVDFCAVIDETACLSCGNCVIKCPRGVIIDTRGMIRKTGK